MIAKINNGASIFGAIEYNQSKVNENHATIIFQNNMIENYTGDSKKDLHFALRSFETYLAANKRTEKPVVHISLNPDPKDQLSDEQYVQLAADYMEKMGFKNQPYIVYKHADIDRIHLHIVSVRVDENGKKLSDSFEKMRSMDACRELETKFRLHPALKKGREFGENVIKKIDYQRGDVKRQISNTVRSLLQMYKFQSLGEFNALLGCYNIDVKHVKGEKFDREYNGIVYSAKNDNGEIVSNPFKSSLFGKMFGFEKLTKTMKNNAEILKDKEKANRLKKVIAAAMKANKTKEDFIKLLQSNGIDVVFRTNEDGRIYGVTFIDHENKVVLNGSRLGKEFSANVFNTLYNTENQRQEQQQEEHQHDEQDERRQEQEENQPEEQQEDERQQEEDKELDELEEPETSPITAKKSDKSLDFEGLFGIFDVNPRGDNYDDATFAQRKRKKKRKKLINNL